MNSYPGLDQVIVDRHDLLHRIPADKKGGVGSSSALGFDDLQFALISQASRI